MVRESGSPICPLATCNYFFQMVSTTVSWLIHSIMLLYVVFLFLKYLQLVVLIGKGCNFVCNLNGGRFPRRGRLPRKKRYS